MNCKQRITLFLIAFWSVTLGVPCFLLWREDRQQRLNQQLIAAIKREDTPAALRLLELGADANAREEPKMTVWQRVWNRLQQHPDIDSRGCTALLLTMQYREEPKGHYVHPTESPALVRSLLAHGARVDAPDPFGLPPLWWALSERSSATARLLIEHGTNLRADTDTADLLTAAIGRQNNAATLALMLEHGADPNQVNTSGSTPLNQAVSGGDTALVRCLLQHHADPNKMIHDPYLHGSPPLAYAKKEGLSEIVKLLKAAGAKE